MKFIFLDVGHNSFLIQVKGDIHKVGSVFPIYKHLDGFLYLSDNNGEPQNTNEGARCLFGFIFTWKGVWEGRIYFEDSEYWSEEIPVINELWMKIETLMKKTIKGENPNINFD